MDKVDQITDSAVDAVGSVDTAVRTVTGAVAHPIRKISGIFAGARHAGSTVRTGGSWQDAVQTGKEEAARREQDIADELRGEE